MAHKVFISGLDTNKLPKMSAEESNSCLQRIKEGDKNAREEFILANLRLVLSIVGRYNDKGNADDLFQVGTVGLIKSLDNFDLKYGVKFSTYAVPMIIGEIRRHIKEQSSIRVTRSMRDTAYKALCARDRLSSAKLVEPSVMEIAEEIDIDPKEVACALNAVSEPISLYESVSGSGEDSMLLMEQLSEDRISSEHNDDIYLLRNALKSLNGREYEVIKLRYFIGKTQTEISTMLNVSQAQVSRLEKNAISKLRAFF